MCISHLRLPQGYHIKCSWVHTEVGQIQWAWSVIKPTNMEITRFDYQLLPVPRTLNTHWWLKEDSILFIICITPPEADWSYSWTLKNMKKGKSGFWGNLISERHSFFLLKYIFSSKSVGAFCLQGRTSHKCRTRRQMFLGPFFELCTVPFYCTIISRCTDSQLETFL